MEHHGTSADLSASVLATQPHHKSHSVVAPCLDRCQRHLWAGACNVRFTKSRGKPSRTRVRRDMCDSCILRVHWLLKLKGRVQLSSNHKHANMTLQMPWCLTTLQMPSLEIERKSLPRAARPVNLADEMIDEMDGLCAISKKVTTWVKGVWKDVLFSFTWASNKFQIVQDVYFFSCKPESCNWPFVLFAGALWNPVSSLKKERHKECKWHVCQDMSGYVRIGHTQKIDGKQPIFLTSLQEPSVLVVKIQYPENNWGNSTAQACRSRINSTVAKVPFIRGGCLRTCHRKSRQMGKTWTDYVWYRQRTNNHMNLNSPRMSVQIDLITTKIQRNHMPRFSCLYLLVVALVPITIIGGPCFVLRPRGKSIRFLVVFPQTMSLDSLFHVRVNSRDPCIIPQFWMVKYSLRFHAAFSENRFSELPGQWNFAEMNGLLVVSKKVSTQQRKLGGIENLPGNWCYATSIISIQ